MTDQSQRGMKLGPRLALLISQAIVATHKALLGTKHKLGMALFNSMSDQISEEVHLTIGPYLQQLAQLESVPDAAKQHLSFFAQQHGQLTALGGAQMAAGSLLGSLAQIVNNAVAPGVREIIRLSPDLALDPVTLASIVAHGIDTESDTVGDVEGQGFNSGQYQALIELALQYPTLPDSLNLYRRGAIDAATLHTNFARAGLPKSQWQAYETLVRQLISPADAALALLRGNMTQAEAYQVADDWGLSHPDFDVLVGNTGEPLGLMQLLEAYRRGIIDKARLERGIRQSRVRDEWIPTAEALRYVPMSVSDAVNATVQNQLPMADAAKYAAENGLEPSHFPVLVNTAGEPLARGEMYELYNRGYVTKAQVLQAERESRLKNKYNDVAFNLHERLLEPRMLSTAVEYGSVTHQEALANAMAYGYSKQLAEILVGEGAARKLQTYKNKVISAIETLYEDGAIDNTTASQTIQSLGFSSEEAGFILEAADMRRATKQTSQVISAIRTKYLGRHITDAEAKSLLSTAGVPSQQVAYLMSDWEIEWQAYTRTLTEAQVVKAVKDGLITPDDGLSRLQAMGYNQVDATLLIEGA